MDTRWMIGQHLVMGFEGLTFSDEARQAVRTHQIANVILFAHNVRDKRQLRRLCDEIQETVLKETGEKAFITIDQEGGVVSRLKEDCAIVPSAMAVAAAGDPSGAYAAGRVTGEELHAVGVNFDLAPVFDVNSNPANPVIGVRSYGDAPERAAAYACEMARGLRDAGILCCAKHFPGHGDTAVDSHLGLPEVNKTMEELEKCELKAFRIAIESGIPGVMSTHILFPEIEKSGLPATMSRAIMTDLLKRRLGFSGLVLSDCMMMGAIKEHFGTVNGMAAALKAGMDLIFSSHSVAYAKEAADRMARMADDGEIDMEELERSTEKIIRFKRGLKNTPPLSALDAVGGAEHRETVRALYEQSATAVQMPREGLSTLGERPLFVSPPPFVVTLASTPSTGEPSFAETMRARFGGTAYTMSTDPGEDEIKKMAALAGDATSVVAGTYNGHLFKGQMRAVFALAERHPALTVFALRNPYDLKEIPPKACGIALYAYNQSTMDLAARILRGEIRPEGRLPVQL